MRVNKMKSLIHEYRPRAKTMFAVPLPRPLAAIVVTYCILPLGKVMTDVVETWNYPLVCRLCGDEQNSQSFMVNGLTACARCMAWFTDRPYIRGLKDYHINAGFLYIGITITTRKMRRALNPRRRRHHREAMMCPVAKTLQLLEAGD